ncbi:MAG: mercury(II) reductase [Candidatus Thioglobus sp.]|nr:mercury(II) reductase [Candidatus Thioglobus pontius]MBL6977012.1 mercury(II) reductase [Candidatus Thioglobus sp.]MBL6984842.1 mercury(II) reductase [Candidatus Thioglobus sp.]
MSDCCQKENNQLIEYDLIVIGAGSGGFSAAITAAEREKKVLLIGYGTIGGTCVNIGCVPSKTLIRGVELAHLAGQTKRFNGISSHAKIVDWGALIEQKKDLVDALRKAKYSDILPEYPNITYLKGKAKLDKNANKTSVLVDGTHYHANHIIIATGSSNAIPPIKGLKEINYLDSTALLDSKQLPESLLIIGAGVIGCELGQAFSRAGVKVSICCRSRLLSNEEPEISDALEGYFQEEGIIVYKGIEYQEIKRCSNGYELSFANSTEKVCAEKVLVCTGRRPNTAALGCEEAGVKLNSKGGIEVNEYLNSSNPAIYAVGDVTGRDMFVYMAAYGAKLAVNNALDRDAIPYDASTMPVVAFTDPQVAHVGLTEKQALQAGFDVKTSVLPLSKVPRAIAARNTNGVIKLVADKKTDQLLGAHICAQEAGDSVQTAVLAIKAQMTSKELGDTVFPYLTMVEGLKLAAQTFDKDVNKLSCCAG